MYSRHRFSGEVQAFGRLRQQLLRLAVLHVSLSYRDIETLMLYRGIEVTYETIWEWCQKFGQPYANQLWRKRLYITDK